MFDKEINKCIINVNRREFSFRERNDKIIKSIRELDLLYNLDHEIYSLYNKTIIPVYQSNV